MQLSREIWLPLLGAIPIDLEISRAGDSGEPYWYPQQRHLPPRFSGMLPGK